MEHFAGNSGLKVGTKIMIIGSDVKGLIGLMGELTHPFPGIIWPNVEYVAGVWLDEGLEGDHINLTTEDVFIVI